MSERDIAFLKATLEGNHIPGIDAGDKRDFQRLLKQDLIRKQNLHDNQGSIVAGETDVTTSETIGNQEDVSPTGGRFIVLSAAQELRPVLHAASSLGMSHQEAAFGKNLIGHRLTWDHEGESTDLWLAVAVRQGVDGLTALLTILSERFDPLSVILAGMMGGIPEKIRLLDVVVPTVMYDGRIVGTKNKSILAEPEPATAHPAIHSILNNIPVIEMDDTEINVKKNKKSLTVAAKHDDISHHLFRKIREADTENIVAFEMEAQAIGYKNHFQQLDGGNVVYGMVKGVADFGGMASGESQAQLDQVKHAINYSAEDGDFDPIRNPVVKQKLQFEATRRALVVAAQISRRITN